MQVLSIQIIREVLPLKLTTELKLELLQEPPLIWKPRLKPRKELPIPIMPTCNLIINANCKLGLGVQYISTNKNICNPMDATTKFCKTRTVEAKNKPKDQLRNRKIPPVFGKPFYFPMGKIMGEKKIEERKNKKRQGERLDNGETQSRRLDN